MRVLFMMWNSFGIRGIMEAFQKKGFTVEQYKVDRSRDVRLNQGMAEEMIRFMAGKNYDFVFSYNYFPVVALACNACKIKYVAWVYDSPQVVLYSNTISFPYNYVFIFDKAVYFDLLKRGIDTVYYLPMAADINKYDAFESNQEIEDIYTVPVSFVGSTYTEKKHQMYKKLQGVNGYTRGYLEGIIQAQKQIYGTLILEDLLTPEIMQEIERVKPWPGNVDGFETYAWVVANYHLARQVTSVERQEILERLSEKYHVALYTHEETPSLPKVDNRGPAGGEKEIAYIFRHSKINLNITLRSIITGMPLRAFDILGSGGFLLTNYQEDFLEYFTPGEDFDYYDSYDSLMEKVEFYLTHEEIRKEVARNGYEKTKKYHTFENRLDTILEILQSQ